MACYLVHTHGAQGQTTCAGCDWKKPTAPALPPRKTFQDGAWRLLSAEGQVGEACPAPGPEERLRWVEEDAALKTAAKGFTFPAIVEAPAAGTKVYKVLTQRDEFFASKFNPTALQELLNRHAAEGWSVKAMTATDVGSFIGSFWGKGGGSSRQELVLLLEKTV